MNAALSAARAIHLNLILVSVAILVLALPGESPSDYREALAVLRPLNDADFTPSLQTGYRKWLQETARERIGEDVRRAFRDAHPEAIRNAPVDAPRHKTNWSAEDFRVWFAACRARLGTEAASSMWLRTAFTVGERAGPAEWPVAIPAALGTTRLRGVPPDWRAGGTLSELARLIASEEAASVPERLRIDPASLRAAVFTALPSQTRDAPGAWVFHAEALRITFVDGGWRLQGELFPLYDWITLDTTRPVHEAAFLSAWAPDADGACVLPGHALRNVGANDAWYWAALPIDAPLRAAHEIAMPTRRLIDWLGRHPGFLIDDPDARVAGGRRPAVIESAGRHRWRLVDSPLWPRIAARSPAAAREWLQDRLDALEAEPSIELLGFQFAGRTLQIGAPIALLALLTYLFIHLQAARARGDGTPGDLAWMGIYPTWSARAATLATLGVLPTLSLLAAAWRFHDLMSAWWTLLGAALTALLSAACLRELAHLRTPSKLSGDTT